MFKTKCGCVCCKGEKVPQGRVGWKSRKNKKGVMYGSTKKVTKGK